MPLLNRLGLWPLTLGLIGLMGVGTAALHFASSTALSAALTLAHTELLAGHYPAELFGMVSGRLARPVNLAQAATPFRMGLLYTWSGRYGWSFDLLRVLAVLSD